MIPPMIRIGAEIITVRAMKTTVWTCWTSFVLRVMSDGGPNLLISTCEKRLDLAEDRARGRRARSPSRSGRRSRRR